MKKKLLAGIFIFLFTVRSCFAVLNVSFTTQNDVCNESHGSITTGVTGGTPPYTYFWSTGATTANLNNIPAGTYTVTVTDFVGSTATLGTTIINHPNLWMYDLTTYIGTNANPYGFQAYPCPSLCNGRVAFYTDLLYGTPPYSLSSNIGVVGIDATGNFQCGCPLPNISGLCAGDFLDVQITDAQGCWWSHTYTILGPQLPNPNIIVSGSCNSMNDGSVTITNINDNYFGIADFITDSLYNHISAQYPWYTTTIMMDSLAPGNYFLEHNFEDTYTPCTHYFPFTIPDLGTNCGNLQGDVFVDVNSNCTLNVGDYLVPDVIMQITPGPVYAYTNQSGHYSLNVPYGTYTVSQQVPASFIQTCTTASTTSTLSSTNQGDTISFADSSNIAFDVSASLCHGIARPGFNFEYAIGIRNYSYTPSGMLTVTLNYDTLLSLVSANPAPFSTSAGQVVWQLSQLTAFQTRGANVMLSVPPNPALIGDTLTASVNVQATTPESFLGNNSASTSHIITGSFDPNVKEVEPLGASFTTDTYLKYTIQFQNTGTDTAFNIQVIDTLDSQLNPLTFVAGASSHPYTAELTGNGVVHFHFNNINLPDSNMNEPQSHGFVSFQIKPDTNISLPAQITNEADIYFDFNPPVTTNVTNNSIYAQASVSVSSSTSAVCTGNCADITASVFSGTPPYTYLWTPNVGAGAGPHTVCPSSTTTYTAVITDANNITSSSSVTVTVNTLPNANITPSGPTTFCQGNSVILTAGGANNYLWSNSSSAQSITVSASGNYFVTVTDGNNCSASTSLSVTVNPLPVASITPNGPTTFCQGDNVMLTASGANNYLWSNSSASQSITVSASGNYLVTVTDGNNCSASTSLSVTVNANPPVPNIIQNFDSLVSDAASGYQWYFSSILIPGANSQSYHPTQNGNYSVVITDVNNCTASSSDYPFVITGMSAPDGADEVLIYPNPATNKIIVQSLKFKIEGVEVYDVVGRLT
ncbi:MAG: hypothetical protein JJE25_01860, partial [Bacteroidia bacterium]|nr:hypothetical protein [Bacteroidia bacterium]